MNPHPGSGSPPPQPIPPEATRTLPGVLAALALTAPFAINMYLPALPGIAEEFGVDVPRIQVSVGLFPWRLGLGQFVGAPVSDRYGRRPTAFTGVAVFAVSMISELMAIRRKPRWLYIEIAVSRPSQ